MVQLTNWTGSGPPVNTSDVRFIYVSENKITAHINGTLANSTTAGSKNSSAIPRSIHHWGHWVGLVVVADVSAAQ